MLLVNCMVGFVVMLALHHLLKRYFFIAFSVFYKILKIYII